MATKPKTKGRTRARIRKVPERRRGFTPFHAPTRPPAGTFDPTIDAQVGATNRGLLDLVQDTEKQGGRNFSDYTLGLADVAREQQRQTADFDTGLGRANTDYGTNTQLLGRRYTQLGQAQAGAQAAAHLSGGGTGLAAQMARAQNQGVEQGALDTTIQRYRADDQVNRTRLSENVTQQRSQLGLSYQRSGEDLTTQLGRGQREAAQFGLDAAQQRFFQAAQSGYAAPSAPASEKTKRGVTYRVKGQGTGRKYTLPNGRQMGRDEWVNWWRHRAAAGGGGHPVLYG